MKNECVPLMPWMPPMPFMPPKMWSNLCPRLFLSYENYSSRSSLESIMSDAVSDVVNSKFSDLEWRLSSIESQLG